MLFLLLLYVSAHLHGAYYMSGEAGGGGSEGEEGALVQNTYVVVPVGNWL